MTPNRLRARRLVDADAADRPVALLEASFESTRSRRPCVPPRESSGRPPSRCSSGEPQADRRTTKYVCISPSPSRVGPLDGRARAPAQHRRECPVCECATGLGRDPSAQRSRLPRRACALRACGELPRRGGRPSVARRPVDRRSLRSESLGDERKHLRLALGEASGISLSWCARGPRGTPRMPRFSQPLEPRSRLPGVRPRSVQVRREPALARRRRRQRVRARPRTGSRARAQVSMRLRASDPPSERCGSGMRFVKRRPRYRRANG